MPLAAITLFLPMVLWAGSQLPPAVAGNACATCHLRRAWTESVTTHVDQWVTSRHALYRVGCEQCHGGDATTSDETAAHRGVINSADPSSPLHWMALPATCGRCHASEANAFAASAHQELLAQGDAMVPTCTSCHSSMATEVPSPAALESRCRHCHRDDPLDRAHVARQALDEVAKLRSTLRRAKLEIAAIADANRRAALSTRWSGADQSLRGVGGAIHAFDERRVEDRLSDVRAQIGGLRLELAKAK